MPAETHSEAGASDVTWGLDVSTNKNKTAAVALRWSPDEARVVRVVHPLRSADIASLIAEHRESGWAVDVPFGWPDLFVDLLRQRHERPLPAGSMPAAADWETWRKRQVAQRRTDRFLTDEPSIRTRPLPASFQLLGATAAMWVLVEAELAATGVEIDRAGITGALCETYPAAALAAWGATKVKGKHDWSMLCALFPFLACDEQWMDKLSIDDVCDAVVCALVARARDLDRTIPPRDADELAAGRREGWIHVSTVAAAGLLQPSN